jgi:hypothetical protein
MPHRMPAWLRRVLSGSGALLLLSGVLWLAVHHGSGAGELPHPLEAWALRLHGLAAFAGLFVMGAVSAAHVPQGWRWSQRARWAGQRRSGLMLCALGAALALTGYTLYYFAPEGIRPALGWAHSGLGVAMGWLISRHRRAT